MICSKQLNYAADGPKTSEYAFFKKLREDIGGYYSRPTDQMKTAKANDRITG